MFKKILLGLIVVSAAFVQANAQGDFDSLFSQARASSHKGDFLSAIEKYTKALNINPKSVAAYNNRGIAHKHMGNFEAAIKDFTSALNIDPKHGSSYYNRANAKHHMGNLESAIEDYTKALTYKPKDSKIYNNRGVAHRDSGSLEQALKDFTSALGLDPKSATAYNNRGMTHAKKGNLENALKDFTSALNIDPNYGSAYYNRGVANQKLGNTAAAKRDLKKAKVHHAKYYKDLAMKGRFKNSSFKAQAKTFKKLDADFNKRILLTPRQNLLKLKMPTSIKILLKLKTKHLTSHFNLIVYKKSGVPATGYSTFFT